MVDYPTFVAFYFDRFPKYPVFEQAANRLRKRCDALGIAHDICKVDLTDYMTDYRRRNPRTVTERRIVYRYIPTFITNKLKQHKRPILYLHCDSVLIRKPGVDLFEPGMDVGYSTNHIDPRLHNVFASPLFFRPSELATVFLGGWSYMCQNFNTDESEHVFLGHTIYNLEYSGEYLELRPFKRQISSEYKKHDPDILFGQALNRQGEVI